MIKSDGKGKRVIGEEVEEKQRGRGEEDNEEECKGWGTSGMSALHHVCVHACVCECVHEGV